MWQLNDKHGPRSGPNSSNEAKQQGGDRTPDRKTEKQKNKKQEQATSEICRKVAEIPPPKAVVTTGATNPGRVTTNEAYTPGDESTLREESE